MSDSNNETPCEPSGTEGRVKYMITTKENTPLEVFRRFIRTLPDGGRGEQMIFDILEEQSYITDLTYEEAKVVAKQPFVDYVILDCPVKITSHMVSGDNTTEQSIEYTASAGEHFSKRLMSGQHLRILSTPRKGIQDDGELDDYTYDPVLGRGQTIYILDAGVNFAHNEFSGERELRTYAVPNEILYSNVNRDLWPAEGDASDHDGHGTLVASVAAGRTHGVASNANLVSVKIKQSYYDPRAGRYVEGSPPRRAIRKAFGWITRDILAQRRQGNTGKAIVCMCQGFDYLPDRIGGYQNYIDCEMKRAFQKCWKYDIITVVSAGNYGLVGGSLDFETPQNLGRPENALITVGGVTRSGVLWPQTSFDRGISGSITVYAVSKDVECADWRDLSASKTVNGTSVSAPVVAGLAAYFASLPSLESEFRPGSVAIDMKRYIARHSHTRTDWPIPTLLPAAYFATPQYPTRLDPKAIKVPYNRAYDGLCSTIDPLYASDGITDIFNSEDDPNTGISRTGTIIVPI